MSSVARSLSALSMMCFATVVVLAPGEARADNMTAARAQYQRGVAAQERGKFKEAAIAYEAAYLLAPDTALLWNAAHAHRLAGNKRRALLLFRSYARQSTDARNEAQPFINQLKVAIEAEAKARAAMAAAAPAAPTTTANSATTPATASPPAATTTAPVATETAAAPAPAEPAVTPVPPSYAPAAPVAATESPAAPAPAAPSLALVPTSAADTVAASAMPVTPQRKRVPRWVWGVLGFLAGAATVSAACGIALQPPTYPSPAIGTIVLR